MKKTVFLVLVILCFSNVLWAHEKRSVGEYEFIVGFLNEPAFSGAMNGLDLRVSKDGQPVEGLEKNLQALVKSPDGKSVMTLTLRKRYKQPGAYAGHFLPVQPGQYSFQVAGKIDGAEVDETFTSGPGTFGNVENAEALRFP